MARPRKPRNVSTTSLLGHSGVVRCTPRLIPDEKWAELVERYFRHVPPEGLVKARRAIQLALGTYESAVKILDHPLSPGKLREAGEAIVKHSAALLALLSVHEGDTFTVALRNSGYIEQLDPLRCQLVHLQHAGADLVRLTHGVIDRRRPTTKALDMLVSDLWLAFRGAKPANKPDAFISEMLENGGIVFKPSMLKLKLAKLRTRDQNLVKGNE